MLGGVHGRDEKKVFAELCQVIEEWVDRAEAEHEQLPEGMAGKKYSGKFNLRLEPGCTSGLPWLRSGKGKVSTIMSLKSWRSASLADYAGFYPTGD
jgi:hypothetical protein